MIETGNFSDFNLSRKRNLNNCTDTEVAKILLKSGSDKFPKIKTLLTETTRFYTESFPELQKFIKREKRLVVFETPSRVLFTHEYTLEGAGALNSGFHFLFNTTERLSWLKISLEGRRVSIASKEKVVDLLKQKLSDELLHMANLLCEDSDSMAWRLYNIADGKPCFVEFNQKEQKGQQSLLFSITFFDSIRNKKNKSFKRWYSPLQEKELMYNYSTISNNANAWIYFKAPANFVLNVSHDASDNFYEKSNSNDDEITSLVLKPQGERLSVNFTISVNVPNALKVWYNGIFWMTVTLCLIGIVLIVIQLFSRNLTEIVKTFESSAFAIIAAIIATRGWLMSEEQVMKKMSNWYTVFVGILIVIIFALTVISMNISNNVTYRTCNGINEVNSHVDERSQLVESGQSKSSKSVEGIDHSCNVPLGGRHYYLSNSPQF